MIYIEQKPTESLSQYIDIDKLWFCQAEQLTNTTLTIPLLHHELVINFSDTYSIYRNERPDPVLKNPKLWVSGIQTGPIRTESAGKHEMMGVLFKPNGLKAFTRYHCSDFENNFIDTTLIFDHSFTTVLDHIHNTKLAGAHLPKRQNILSPPRKIS